MAEDVNGLVVGSQVQFQRQVSPETIEGFVEVSGDTNPLHTDEVYAARTRFKRPIAHGMIGASFISATIATRLSPGSVMVYLSQDLEFVAPVYVYDVLTISCTVTAIDPARHRVTVETIVVNQDSEEVIRGEAKVLVDTLRDA